MIIILLLANISISSHNYHYFLCVLRTFKMYSLNNFHVHNTVVLLTLITMSCIRPELICILIGNLYPLTNVSSFL